MNERTGLDIRLMQPDDADVVRASYRALSAMTLRRYRFFSPILTRSVLDDLVIIDDRRIVLLAFDCATGALIGDARAVRHRHDQATADLAVTVGDRWQRCGGGTTLLRAVSRECRRHGIDRLAGHVLVDNLGGQALLRAASAEVIPTAPGILAFDLALGRSSSPLAVTALRTQTAKVAS